MHTLVVGTTGGGKSSWAKQFAAACVPTGFPIGILDPTYYEGGWPSNAFVTDDIDTFEEWAALDDNINAWLFIDEGHGSIGANRWDDNLHWMFRGGRHHGFKVTVITQYPTDLPPAIRGQCHRIVCFNIDGIAAKSLAVQLGQDCLMDAPTLPLLQFIYVNRVQNVTARGQITF